MIKSVKQVPKNTISKNLFDRLTKHQQERHDRFALADALGCGTVYDAFICDTGHENGLENHIITDTGLIYIQNNQSKKLITVLVARPGQIRRYYEKLDLVPPQELVDIAREHQLAGYNHK